MSLAQGRLLLDKVKTDCPTHPIRSVLITARNCEYPDFRQDIPGKAAFT